MIDALREDDENTSRVYIEGSVPLLNLKEKCKASPTGHLPPLPPPHGGQGESLVPTHTRGSISFRCCRLVNMRDFITCDLFTLLYNATTMVAFNVCLRVQLRCLKSRISLPTPGSLLLFTQ